MPRPHPLAALALALVACTDRPVGESTDGDPGTNGSTTNQTTTAVDPTAPTTTGLDTTTSGAGETTATSAATTAVLPPDLPPQPMAPAGFVGCNLEAPAGTAVAGASKLGPFVAARAYFGAFTVNTPAPILPLLLFVSDEADPADELEYPDGESGQVLFGRVETEALAVGWTGSWTYYGDLLHAGMTAGPGLLTVHITELAGNWDAADPDDPPRLVGILEGAIAGPFDAVYCAELDESVIAT